MPAYLRARRVLTSIFSLFLSQALVCGNMAVAVDFDLSSGNLSGVQNVSGSNNVTIQVGSGPQTINSSSQVTAAEQVAVNQVLATGRQNIIINDVRVATAGSFNLRTDLPAGVNNLSIPSGVTGLNNFGGAPAFNLTGDLVNAGTLYFLSNMPSFYIGTLNATNIVNEQTGLISSILPTTLRSEHNALTYFCFNLNATNDIINHGQIVSGGKLSLRAGNSIINTMQPGGPLPNITSSDVGTMAANTIINSGNISVLGGMAMDGHLNIQGLDKTLLLDNTGGTLSANTAYGNLTISVPTQGPDSIVKMIGGDYKGRQVYIRSGSGRIDANLGVVHGPLHVDENASSAIVGAASGDLTIWDRFGPAFLTLNGDRTYFNKTGNVSIEKYMSTDGHDLTLLAGQDTLLKSGEISTRSSTGEHGGDVLFIAGTSIQTTDLDPTSLTTGTTLTANGQSATGGRVYLGSLGFASFSTNDTHAGDITLIAYGNGHPTLSSFPGQVIAGQGLMTIGGQTDGNVTIIAGAKQTPAHYMASFMNSGSVFLGKNGVLDIYHAIPEGSVTFTSEGLVDGGITAGTLNATPMGYQHGSYSMRPVGGTVHYHTAGNFRGSATYETPVGSSTFGSSFILSSGGPMFIAGDIVGLNSDSSISLSSSSFGGTPTYIAPLPTSGIFQKAGTDGALIANTVNLSSAGDVAVTVGASGLSSTTVITASGEVSLQAHGPLTINSSTVGGSFHVLTADSLTVNGTVTAGGAVGMLAGVLRQGTLNVAPNTVLTAGSNLTLQNFSLSGNGINIANGAKLTSNGDMNLLMGNYHATPTLGTTPEGVTVTLSGGGQVFFGEPLVSAAGLNQLIANGASLVFSGPESGPSIELGGNTILQAKPYSAGSQGSSGYQTTITSLDLGDPAAVAKLVDIQQKYRHYVGGQLIVEGGVATGGTLIVPRSVGLDQLSALNIPEGVTVVFEDFLPTRPVFIQLTETSSTSQTVIDGHLAFDADVAAIGAMRITSNQLGPALVVQGQLSSSHSLEVTTGGNVAVSGSISAPTSIVLQTAQSSNGNIDLAGLLESNDTVRIAADGGGSVNFNTGTISGAALFLSSETGLIDVHGNLQSTNSIFLSSGGSINARNVHAPNISIIAGGTALLHNVNADATSAGHGGIIDIIANTIDLSSGAYAISANAGGPGSFDGGIITVSAGSIVYPSGNAILFSANGTGSGNGGVTSLTLNGNPDETLRVSDDENSIRFSATGGSSGSDAGDGGGVLVTTAGNLQVNPNAISAGPLGDTGDGATISLHSGANLKITGSVSASGVGSGDGGSIELSTNSQSAFMLNNDGENSITGVLSANSGANGGSAGSISLENKGTGGIVVDSFESLSLTAINGDGGHLSLKAAGALSLPLNNENNVISMDGTGEHSKGGSLLFSAATINIPAEGRVTLSANGPAAGGSLTLVTTDAESDLTVGQDLGTVSLSARALDSNAGALSGGAIVVSSGGSLDVDVEHARFGAADNDNITGGEIALSAGEGKLTVNGDLSANSKGSGDAGRISLTGGSNGLNANGSLSADASGNGSGGSIEVTVNNPDTLRIGDSNSANYVDGTMTATSMGGTAGSIVLNNHEPSQFNVVATQTVSTAGTTNGTIHLDGGSQSVDFQSYHNLIGVIGGSGKDVILTSHTAGTIVVGNTTAIDELSVNSNGGITVQGSLTAASIILNEKQGHSISILGNLEQIGDTTLTLAVSGGGTITQAPHSVITANVVDVSSEHGIISLLGSNNEMSRLTVNTSESVTVNNHGALEVGPSQIGEEFDLVNVGSTSITGLLSASQISITTSSLAVLNSVISTDSEIAIQGNGTSNTLALSFGQNGSLHSAADVLFNPSAGQIATTSTSSGNIQAGPSFTISFNGGSASVLVNVDSLTGMVIGSGNPFTVITNNQVQLGSITSTGTLSVTAAGNITTTAPISGQSVTLQATAGSDGAISINKTITAANTLTLISNGTGAITFGPEGNINSNALHLVNGDNDLGSLSNPWNISVSSLTLGTSGSAFIINTMPAGQTNLNLEAANVDRLSLSNDGHITISAPTSANMLSLNLATDKDIRVNANLTIRNGGDLELRTSGIGKVTGSSTAVITADELTIMSSSIDLQGANKVSHLAADSATGVAFKNTIPLTIDQSTATTFFDINNSESLNLGDVSFNNGSIYARSLTISGAVQAGGDTLLQSNAFEKHLDLSFMEGSSISIATGRLKLNTDPSNTGNVRTITSGTGSLFAAPGATLELYGREALDLSLHEISGRFTASGGPLTIKVETGALSGSVQGFGPILLSAPELRDVSIFASRPGGITLTAPEGSQLTLSGTGTYTDHAGWPQRVDVYSKDGIYITGTHKFKGSAFFDAFESTVEAASEATVTVEGTAASVVITANTLINPGAFFSAYKTIFNIGGPTTEYTGSILNWNGDIILTPNMVINNSGKDLAIFASGNILSDGVPVIDLSSANGNGGNLTVLAGVAFSPKRDNQGVMLNQGHTFFIDGPSTTGGNINLTKVDIKTSSTSIDPSNNTAGNIIMVAHNGTLNAGVISVGALTASSANGEGGDIKLVAAGGVNVSGAIQTSGYTKGGSVKIYGATPAKPTVVTIKQGHQIGASDWSGFFNSPLAAGILIDRGIDSSSAAGSAGSVLLTAQSNIDLVGGINASGYLSGGSINVHSTQGHAKLSGNLKTIGLDHSTTINGANGGSLTITTPYHIAVNGVVETYGGNTAGSIGGAGGDVTLTAMDPTHVGTILVNGYVNATGGNGVSTGGAGGDVVVDAGMMQIRGVGSTRGGLGSVVVSGGKGVSRGAGGTIALRTYATQPIPANFNLASTSKTEYQVPGGFLTVGISPVINGTAGNLVSNTSVIRSTSSFPRVSCCGTSFTAKTTIGGVSISTIGATNTGGVAAPAGTNKVRIRITPSQAVVLYQKSTGQTQTFTTDALGKANSGSVLTVAASQLPIGFTSFNIPANFVFDINGPNPTLNLSTSSTASFPHSTINFNTSGASALLITGSRPLTIPSGATITSDGPLLLSSSGAFNNAGTVTASSVLFVGTGASVSVQNSGTLPAIDIPSTIFSSISLKNTGNPNLSADVSNNQIGTGFGRSVVPKSSLGTLNVNMTGFSDLGLRSNALKKLNIVANSGLKIDSGSDLYLHGDLIATSSSFIDNPDSILYTDGSITMRAQTTYTGFISGMGAYGGSVKITAPQGIDLGHGGIFARDSITLESIQGPLTTRYWLRAGNDIYLKSGGNMYVKGRIEPGKDTYNNPAPAGSFTAISAKKLEVWADITTNNGDITLKSGKEGTVIGDHNYQQFQNIRLEAIGGKLSIFSLGPVTSGQWVTRIELLATPRIVDDVAIGGTVEIAAGTHSSNLANTYAGLGQMPPEGIGHVNFHDTEENVGIFVSNGGNINLSHGGATGQVYAYGAMALTSNVAPIILCNVTLKSTGRPVAYVEKSASASDTTSGAVTAKDEDFAVAHCFMEGSNRIQMIGSRGGLQSVLRPRQRIADGTATIAARRGHMLLNPLMSLKVETTFGEIEAKRNALLSLSIDDNSLHVVNCGKIGDVKVRTAHGIIEINPGEETVVTTARQYHGASDGIGRRRIRPLGTAAGNNLFVSDVSLSSMIGASEHLQALRNPMHPIEKSIAGRLLKTAAAIDLSTRSRGAYSARIPTGNQRSKSNFSAVSYSNPSP
jgi:hypothetical protein